MFLSGLEDTFLSDSSGLEDSPTDETPKQPEKWKITAIKRIPKQPEKMKITAIKRISGTLTTEERKDLARFYNEAVFINKLEGKYSDILHYLRTREWEVEYQKDADIFINVMEQFTIDNA